MTEPRAFDHFVFPVASLAAARERFTALGFTVAPDARHPFGTANCCIFLEDGTFLEPLAIGDPAAYAAALEAGNAFVGNDARFRAASSPVGLSQLVLQTADAAADHDDFDADGFSGGKLLDFGRTFTRPDGTTGEVAFRLAFAAPQPPLDTGYFACQVVKAVPGGRGALTSHANGAVVTVCVVGVADDPLATDEFFSFLLESESEVGVEVSHPASNGALRIMRPDVFRMVTDLFAPEVPALRLMALVIGVPTLDAVRAIVRENGVSHHEKPGWLIVPPAAGQGVAIIFQGAE